MASHNSHSRGSTRKRILGVVWLLSLVMLQGCRGFQEGNFVPVEEETARQVLESLRQKESEIATLKGLFQASITGAGALFSQDLNGMVAYRQPDQMHLKGFIRLGVPVLDFHREGNHYELYIPAEGKVVSGRVENSRQGSEWDQIVALSLQAFDAVLGKIPGVSGSGVHVLRDEESYRIDINLPGPGSTVSTAEVLVRTWVEPQTMEIEKIEYLQPIDDLMVSVRCEDYREVGIRQGKPGSMVRLPFRVQATDHRIKGGVITLTFQEFIVNAA